MADNNLFLGIDLGTTNSVIAYAHFNGNKLQANAIKVPRMSERGSSLSAATLPSVVFYRSDRKNGKMLPIVGDFAKAQYGKKYGYVVKSVKSCMGMDKVPGISPELPDQRPEEVSAQILRHLLSGAQTKLTLKEYPADVVITIPASFDADMRTATYRAANLAGLEVYNKDGSFKDMLLYEPKAVLYNFINEQLNGEIPAHLVDFSTPKNILVYDIGGGTLDVSIHRVAYEKDSAILKIADLGISLHHLLAGDDFDRLIAQKLLQRFLEDTPQLHSLSKEEENELLAALTAKAEEAKISLSEKYTTCRQMNGEILPDDTEEYISEINLYKGNSFDYPMSKKEMDEWIKPLLAENLSLEDYKRIEGLGQDKVKNIIYPVLDALAKASLKVPDLKIDQVILNGGMSKFYPIVDRLKQFFGLEPIVITDPDMSVAKGAVIYHYYMHKYNMEGHTVFDGQAGVEPSSTRQENFFALPKAAPQKPAQPAEAVPAAIAAVGPQMKLGAEILNNTLSIGIRNGYVEEIAPAGQELPFISEVIEKFALPSACRRVSIPFYVGRGKTTQLPNRRIASRVISFQSEYPADTRISMKIGIDRQGLLHLKAWITDNPGDFGEITVSSNTAQEEIKSTAVEKIVPLPGGRHLIPTTELHELTSICHSLDQATSGSPRFKELSGKLRRILTDLKTCSNPADFGKPIIERLYHRNISERLQQVLISIGRRQYIFWPENVKKDFYIYCEGLLEPLLYSRGIGIGRKNVRIEVINAIEQFDKEHDRQLLEKLIALHDTSFALPASVVYAKRGFPPEAIARYLLSYPAASNIITSPLWALGKTLSREAGYYAKKQDESGLAAVDKELLPQIFRHLNAVLRENKNPTLRNIAAYALGEIADQREAAFRPISGPLLTTARQIFQAYKKSPNGWSDSCQFDGRMMIVEKLLAGTALSATENAQLLKLRESC